jgi:hypothetical protein
MAAAAHGRTMVRMIQAQVTEIAQRLEPTTEDSFVYVAITDRPDPATAARIAELFGTGSQRNIVD